MLWKFQIVTFLCKVLILFGLFGFFFFKQTINEARLKLKTLSHLRQVSQVKVQLFHPFWAACRLTCACSVLPDSAHSWHGIWSSLLSESVISGICRSHSRAGCGAQGFVPVPLDQKVSELAAWFYFLTAHGPSSGQYPKGPHAQFQHWLFLLSFDILPKLPALLHSLKLSCS